ncbi:MAG: hypothetical protein AAF236_02495 [Verrucomicrobiota bacterium]
MLPLPRLTDMPFQPVADPDQTRKVPHDIGLLILRVLVVGAFCYYQQIGLLLEAWGFTWSGTDWQFAQDLADQTALPFPGIIAVATVVVLTIVLFGLLLGLLTRINAAIAFVFIGAAMVLPFSISSTLNQQSLLIYLIAFLTLTIASGGHYTLDRSLSAKRRR